MIGFNKKEVERDLKNAKIDESYHRKHMEYYLEKIEIIEEILKKLKSQKRRSITHK